MSTTSADNPLALAFLEAGKQAGYLATEDVNGFQQDGFGLLPKNVAGGRRSSTAYCYLRNPPGNLHIKTNSHVRRLLMEGKTVTGVDYVRDGQDQTSYTRAEVVISAGAFNSPKILMQSGIGAGAELREFGIEVLHDLPGVGKNLMDHPLTAVQVKCTQPVTLYKHLNPISKALGVMQWLTSRKGLLANNHFDVVGFIRTRAGIRFPNLQIALFQIAVAEGTTNFLKEHSFQLQFSNQRPLSRGFIKLSSRDPFAPPSIRLNLLEQPEDIEELKAGFRLSRELLQQRALASFTGEEIFPGDQVNSDTALEQWLRETCYSSYHPCGTCKMGTDTMSVVDPQCRVRGIENL